MGEDRTGEPQANQERLTVAQAAIRLGITEGAVRSRIKRGTLPTTKEGGAVFVLWAGGSPAAYQTTNAGVPGDQSALVEALRDQIEDLRQERDEWREQARITDRLLSAAMERIPPQLEAPQEPPEDAETVEEAPDRAEARFAAGEAQDELDTERARREVAETTMREGMSEERRRREAAERERDDLREQLYAHSRQQGAYETAEEQQGRGQRTGAAPGLQEVTRRPWWRRVFGR